MDQDINRFLQQKNTFLDIRRQKSIKEYIKSSLDTSIRANHIKLHQVILF